LVRTFGARNALKIQPRAGAPKMPVYGARGIMVNDPETMTGNRKLLSCAQRLADG
jgi:hypothetical protein